MDPQHPLDRPETDNNKMEAGTSAPHGADRGPVPPPQSAGTAPQAQAVGSGIRLPASLDLGFLPKASSSQNSLLEAVVGRADTGNAGQFTTRQAAPIEPTSSGTTGFGTSTERSWDVLSDASLRMNGLDDEAVENLQKKVDKRKSNLPALETELAALEAKIKEAEARLAKAQGGPQTG